VDSKAEYSALSSTHRPLNWRQSSSTARLARKTRVLDPQLWIGGLSCVRFRPDRSVTRPGCRMRDFMYTSRGCPGCLPAYSWKHLLAMHCQQPL